MGVVTVREDSERRPPEDRLGQSKASSGQEGTVLVDVDGDGRPDQVQTASEVAELEAGRLGPGVPAQEPAGEAVSGLVLAPPVVRASVVGGGERLKPIVPEWMRSKQGRSATLSWWRRRTWHQVRWYAWNALPIACRVAYRAPRGARRLVWWWLLWALDVRADAMEQTLTAGTRNDALAWLKVRADRAARIRARMVVSLMVAAGSGVGALVVLLLARMVALRTMRVTPIGRLPITLLEVRPTAPAPVWWAVLALVAMGLAKAGTDRDAPLVGTPVTPFEAPRLSAPMVEAALGALGIAAITAALKPGGEGIRYPSPIHRDEGGLGWRADIDLPLGVVPADIMEKRSELASALRRQLGCVWPEGDPDIHEGRLVLRVLDQDLSKLPPPPWPLLRSCRHDYFAPYPFGWDTRGRLISLPLFELNMLVGALPGQGKSATMRVAACAAALDPTVELWIMELAGKGDFAELEPVCHVYVNGVDDDSIRATAAALAALRRECERRLTVLGRDVPASMKPDKKVTREIAGRPQWGLHPLVAFIDECQNVFTHREVGKQASEDAEVIIRTSRAAALTLILGTQRPDAKSIPSGVTALTALRFCLKVMDQTANDMILGTSMYKAGYRATAFRAKVDAGIGILVGATPLPSVVRSVYLDGPTVERIAKSARALREEAGTLSGHALGEEPTVLVDVVSVVRDAFGPDETALWTDVLLERIRTAVPGHFDDWEPAQLTTTLKAAGISAGRQVERYDEALGKRVNRNGVYLADLPAALPAVPEPSSGS